MTDAERTEWRIRAAKAVGWNPRNIPNPFESADDCEALLVATMQRGWYVYLVDSTDEVARTILANAQQQHGTSMVENKTKHSDPRAAYRESVTKACVQAFEAIEEAKIHPAKPLAEGDLPPRK